MVQVPNQLVGAPTGTNVTLVCLVEASPKAINYWTRESGKIQLTVSTVVYFSRDIEERSNRVFRRKVKIELGVRYLFLAVEHESIRL